MCTSDALDQTREDCIKPRETAVRASSARLGLFIAMLTEYLSLLGCYTISFGKHIQTFRRIVFPSSSRPDRRRLTPEFERGYLTWRFFFRSPDGTRNMHARYLNCVTPQCSGHEVAQLVESLRYKQKVRGLDSRWRHWNSGRITALQYTQPITEMSTRDISWG